MKVANDFLPPPEQLVLKEDNVKVTIALKTIKITLDDELIATIDQIVKKLKMTRSAFICKALRDAILAELEQKHRSGYRQHPVEKEEFNT